MSIILNALKKVEEQNRLDHLVQEESGTQSPQYPHKAHSFFWNMVLVANLCVGLFLVIFFVYNKENVLTTSGSSRPGQESGHPQEKTGHTLPSAPTSVMPEPPPTELQPVTTDLPSQDAPVAQPESLSPPFKASATPESTRAPLAAYAGYFKRIDRQRNAAYEKITPVPGTPRGSLTCVRDPHGEITFSIATLVNHIATRSDELFRMTPDTLSELGLVFQIAPGEAYVFVFDGSGVITVPRDFWDSFARISKKAVSLSRIVKNDAQGMQIRDLLSLTINAIHQQIR